MADTRTIIEQAYSAFNKRVIDGALALMTEDVSWPKASEGAFSSRFRHTFLIATLGLVSNAATAQEPMYLPSMRISGKSE